MTNWASGRFDLGRFDLGRFDLGDSTYGTIRLRAIRLRAIRLHHFPRAIRLRAIRLMVRLDLGFGLVLLRKDFAWCGLEERTVRDRRDGSQQGGMGFAWYWRSNREWGWG